MKKLKYKRCPQCGDEKTTGCFSPSKHYSDGLDCWCKLYRKEDARFRNGSTDSNFRDDDSEMNEMINALWKTPSC